MFLVDVDVMNYADASKAYFSSMAGGGRGPHSTLQFPTYNVPRIWLLTSGNSPVGISLARQVMNHGEYVVSGIIPSEFEKGDARSEEFTNILKSVGGVEMAGRKD